MVRHVHADTREYAFHLQFVRAVGGRWQRTDAGDATFSRFRSLTVGWLHGCVASLHQAAKAATPDDADL